MGKQVIKVLLGMHRVGKSTLLLQIQEKLLSQGVEREQIISLNFEWLELEPLKVYRALYEYIESKKVKGKKSYVLLGEIEEIEGFEKVVNSWNSKGDIEVFITGANSKLLSGELATYLTGRFYTIEILPLSYKEVSERFSKNEDVFLEYVKIGGSLENSSLMKNRLLKIILWICTSLFY